MADKTIGSLPQAQTVDDASLFVCEQQGTAMKTTGAQWKGFAVNAVSQYVEPAQQAAQQAQQAAQQAQDAADSIGDSVSQAQTAAQQAQAAQQAVENLGVTSNTLPVGQEATVTKTVDETGAVTLAFGIPQGPRGPQGPQGAKGDTGPRGPQGETGEGFVVKGYFATLSALQSGVPSPSAGDAYGVGSAEPYDIYIWDGVNSAWVNNGPLQGAKGPQGDPGSAATIEIGTVTTAPAGSNAAVTNSGTSSAAVLNFTIPQGATGPAGEDGAPGATGPKGEPGANATINGVNALTITTTGGIKGSQSGSTYTIDGSGLVAKVSGAAAGNVPIFTENGQVEDSGKGIDDLGKNDFVVTFSGEVSGPFTADKTFSEISAAYNAGSKIYAKYALEPNLITNINLRIYISGDPSKFVFTGSFFGYNIGLIEFSVSDADEVTGSVMLSHEHKPSEITDLAGTDYTTSRVRGIALSTSTPGTIPNGCLVGVYE